MPWEAITYVSSGLTLIAFIVAIVAWVIKNQADANRKLIEAASDDTKANLVDKALDLIHIDTTGLTKDQRYNLAMELIRRRAERSKIIAIVVCILALIGSGATIFSNERKQQIEFIPPDKTTIDSESLSINRNTETGNVVTKPLPPYTIHFCQHDYYADDDTSKCQRIGTYTGMVNQSLEIFGHAANPDESIEGWGWTALIVDLEKCDLCRMPNSIDFVAATQSGTACSIIIDVDPNNIGKFNETIAIVDLSARQQVSIPISEQIRKGMSSFQITPNPSGCYLVLESFVLR